MNLLSNWQQKVYRHLEDLADQGIDDLEGIEGLDEEERAGELIMAARNICWFGEEE